VKLLGGAVGTALPGRLAASQAGRRACLVVIAAAALGATSACQRPAPSFKGIDITGAEYGRSFSLPDADGVTRTLADFKGKLVLVFFGFTQCPDVCPTTLSRAVEVRKLLGPDADKVQVVLITVDPERDTPEVLRDYVKAFDPSFVALRGDAASTAATAKEFKVFFQKVQTSSSYTMDHTAVTYVCDPKGRVRLALRHEQSAADVAADLKTLLRE
jgi:protein SCO1/2